SHAGACTATGRLDRESVRAGLTRSIRIRLDQENPVLGNPRPQLRIRTASTIVIAFDMLEGAASPRTTTSQIGIESGRGEGDDDLLPRLTTIGKGIVVRSIRERRIARL